LYSVSVVAELDAAPLELPPHPDTARSEISSNRMPISAIRRGCLLIGAPLRVIDGAPSVESRMSERQSAGSGEQKRLSQVRVT
jgi:hypothetical protein